MVKVIMGLKGEGKTKKLIDLVKKAIDEEHGDVVVIESKKELTYDIPYRARLVQYNESGYDFLRGFVSGLQSGNYDITPYLWTVFSSSRATRTSRRLRAS